MFDPDPLKVFRPEHRDVRTVLQTLAREVDAARALVSTAPVQHPEGQLVDAEWRQRSDVLESLALCRATLADALHAVEAVAL